MFVTNSN